MNTTEFIEKLVKIEFIESENSYGHYPFQLFVETSESELFEMNSLMLGGDVISCYKRVRDYVRKNAKEIYLSLDFPKGKDISNDFVCVLSIKGDVCEILAIPYDTKTGETYEIITNSELLDEILLSFKTIVFKTIKES
jgi:hypothetical protein